MILDCFFLNFLISIDFLIFVTHFEISTGRKFTNIPFECCNRTCKMPPAPCPSPTTSRPAARNCAHVFLNSRRCRDCVALGPEGCSSANAGKYLNEPVEHVPQPSRPSWPPHLHSRNQSRCADAGGVGNCRPLCQHANRHASPRRRCSKSAGPSLVPLQSESVVSDICQRGGAYFAARCKGAVGYHSSACMK